ncbi:MAG TPA: hypothetical protein VG778_11320 [Blastocatellia bacterium]|nr:hypothetical protein [Blastocatellia bacterium]
MYQTRVALVTTATILLTFLSSMPSRAQQQGRQDVDRLIEKLWSSDEERLAAKKELSSLGPEVIVPLQLLLEEIISNFRSRYEIGKEKEVADARDWYQRAKDSGDSEEQRKASSYWAGFEITNRLKQDALDLLVSHKAEAAVPVMLELSLRGPNFFSGLGGGFYILPEMQALIEMGSIAVPRLTEFLVTIPPTARKRAGGNPTNSPSAEPTIDWASLKLQRHAIIVLAKIRDPRALPALQRLQVETIDEGVKLLTGAAIVEILGGKQIPSRYITIKGKVLCHRAPCVEQ